MASAAVGRACSASAAEPSVVRAISLDAASKLSSAGLSNAAPTAVRSLLVPAGSNGESSGPLESLLHPAAKAARATAARTRVAECRTRMKSPPETGRASARPNPASDSDLAGSVRPGARSPVARPRIPGQWLCRSSVRVLLLVPDRQSGLLPRRPPAGERPRLGPSCLPKLSRHPGACGFVLSGTVEDQDRVAVEAALAGQPHGVVGRKAERADGHLGALAVAPLGAHVEQDDRLAGGLEGERLGDGDAFARR